jgi:NTE family protein
MSEGPDQYMSEESLDFSPFDKGATDQPVAEPTFNEELIRYVQQEARPRSLDSAPGKAFQIAAIYLEFTFPQLESLLQEQFDTRLDKNIEESLRENSIYDAQKAVYSLENSIRAEVLARISLSEIAGLIVRIGFDPSDWRQNLLNALLTCQITDSAQLKPGEYVQAYAFTQWIKQTEIPVLSENTLLKLIRRQDLVLPFQRLTANFNGRTESLQEIGRFVAIPNGTNLNRRLNYLFVTGVGGIGKSTLVAKYILEELNSPKASVTPFVYIDFDNPRFSISNIFGLIKEALSQLALQNPRYENRLQQLTAQISQEYGFGQANTSTSRSSDRSFFYQDMISEADRLDLKTLQVPLLLVFDSFEELQFRSTPTEINVLFRTLDEILRIIPTLKVVFIGRSDIFEHRGFEQQLFLEAFDKPAAVLFLQSLQLQSQELCEALFDAFGGSPLTLQLVASLLLKESPSGSITLEEVKRNGFFEKIDRQLIQQQLVARNLDHIHNKEVAAIAVPGILLRKIDPEIIEQVLAVPCGLGAIDLQKATSLFEELKKETFLLKQEGETVEFRKDLRVSLYDLILKEPKYKAFAVHNAAVDYYRDRPDPENQSEYLFHRLKRGDDVSIIRDIYEPSMKPYLETALSELPPAASFELSLAMGLRTGGDEVEQLPPDRWQLFLLSQIRNALDSGDEKDLDNIYKKLLARTERTGQPEFLYYERLVKIRLNKPVDLSWPANHRGETLPPCLELKFRLSTIYELELKQNFEAAWQLVKLDLPVVDWEPSVEGIRLLLEYFYTETRLIARVGRGVSNSHIPEMIGAQLKALSRLGEMTLAEFFLLFPKPYCVAVRERYVADFPNTNLNVLATSPGESNRYLLFNLWSNLLRKIGDSRNYLSAAEFDDNYTKLRHNIGSFAELERFARRTFRYYMKDISLPGALDVCIYDLLLLAESAPRDSKELVLEKVSVASDFRGTRNIAGVEDFLSMSGVKACLERLDNAFPKDGKKKLIVSDILDEDGHQYVNLVQRSSGIHYFALLGYTHILEKMGIRFLKLAGSNTAAINAGFHGVAGPKNEELTPKVLDHFIKLDHFSLQDGPKLSRLLLRMNKNKKLGMRLNRLWMTFFALLIGTWLGAILLLFFSFDFSRYAPVMLFCSGFMFLISWVLMAWGQQLFKKLVRFGGGLNPGLFLYDWIANVFRSFDVATTEDLASKATTLPKLLVREGMEFNTSLLKGEISFICAEVLTQNKIIFPAMSNLFVTKENANVIGPAFFVRAAASLPLFFESAVLNNLQTDHPEIKQAWIDTFAEYNPPASACLVDGGVLSAFPINIFQNSRSGQQPLPTFGVDTTQANRKFDTTDLKKLSLFTYILRLLDSGKYNRDTEQVARDRAMERSICRINIDKISYLDFFLTDENKLDLFNLGAQAATEFLIGFDWEVYKKLVNTQVQLRL